jgi:Ca-activated chloride channel family protein
MVTFDSEVEVVLPLAKIEDKERVCEIIRNLSTRGMTYLSGGWEQAKEQLKKAEPGILKRMLLLTDGMANRGVTDHRELITLVGDGLRNDGIRTSCLGFGDHYQEDLLSDMATHSTGNFYDVDSKEKLPTVFAAELEGALRISVENLRVRIKPEEQCVSWDDFGGMRKTALEDGRSELLVGDLVSEEVRSFALELKVRSADSGTINDLISMEFVYDLVLEEGTESKIEKRTVEISFVDNPDEVVLDDTILSIITTQRTSKIIREAIEKIDRGEELEAIEFLRGELKKLEELERPELIADSEMLIRSTIEKIEMGWRRSRGRKFAQYSSRSYSKMSSSEYWSADESYSPSFKGTNDDEL